MKVKSTEEANQVCYMVLFFCNDDNGQTGSLLTSEETTKEDALVVAIELQTEENKV
jgi:hypothetical protein